MRASAAVGAALAIALSSGFEARAGGARFEGDRIDVEQARGTTPPAGNELTADLDGKPIKLVEVANWYCHDFDYPAIHCFSNPDDLQDEPAVMLAAAAAGTQYATVYEFTFYQGAYMHMTENYSMLSLLGWSDRISSFVAKNGMSGAFWTDWLYTGYRYNFCCNQQLSSLGSYNDSFSSVFHN